MLLPLAFVCPLEVRAATVADGLAAGLALAMGSFHGNPWKIADFLGSVTMSGNATMTEQYRNVLNLDPAGSNRTVTLPAEADGLLYVFRHGGDNNEVITINDDAAAEVHVLRMGRMVLIICDGTTWYAAPIGEIPVARKAFQTIDMADAQAALVYGTAGAGEVKIVADRLIVDANSSGTEDLLLPPEATSAGRELFIHNSGGEDIVVKEDGDSTTICTISTAESAFVFCDGTTWRGGVVKAT